jgi:hypothetical protein
LNRDVLLEQRPHFGRELEETPIEERRDRSR